MRSERAVGRDPRRVVILKCLALIVVLSIPVQPGCSRSVEESDRPTLDRALETVSESHLREFVHRLADDHFDGRGAGYPGERAASVYIADRFREYGLDAGGDEIDTTQSFLQSFEFHPLEPPTPWRVLQTQNVIGILEGGELSSEYVVVGAHHDGQGREGQANPGRWFDSADTATQKDPIWNSAVDNATGVAGILEMARVLAVSGYRPRRSIVFVTFSAEEYALNGSAHYVNDPPRDWSRHVAMINLEKLVGDPDAELITASSGTSPDFDRLTAMTNDRLGMQVESFFPGIIADTDHFPFVVAGLPAMVIGTGSAADVHYPSDTADKLDYASLEQRVRFVLAFVLELANLETIAPSTMVPVGFAGIHGGAATPAELRAKNSAAGAGFKVCTVLPGLAGHAAGIEVGDLIVRVDQGEVPAEWITDGTLDALLEPGRDGPVQLEIIRGDQAISTTIP